MQAEDVTNYLTIEHLWKSFGTFQALKDISLTINRGEFVCFLGPSGCGKTTLLRAIAGLDLQTSGVVHQNGQDISNLPPAERDFGIVFQSYALFPNLTIEKNIAFGLENTGTPRDKITARVTELLSLVGLNDQASKYPAQLSGGQQQRVALARALAMSPGLLLLDEPLSALDAKVRVHLRHEIKDLQRKLGVTTIMVTHDQEEALVMADRIVVMNHGVVEQVGTPTDIYREPTSLFAADFIGEMNQLPASTDDSGQHIHIGECKFACTPYARDGNGDAVAAIRPEDVIPHAITNAAIDIDDAITEEHNTIDATVDEMDFLGSFWRARLSNTQLGTEAVTADFSINAVRRLNIAVGGQMRIEIPSERLKVFPGSATPGA